MQMNQEELEDDVYMCGMVAGIVEKHYQQLFSEIVKVSGDEIEDLVVLYTDYEGRTVRVSWKEREQRLTERGVFTNAKKHPFKAAL
jgi:hypothetical protein